jgi:N utilization substance protein A
MARTNLPRTEFAQALRALATERGLDAEIILESVKDAIVAAFKRDQKELTGEEKEGLEYEVVLDKVTGGARVFEYPEGKSKEKKDVTPPGFGRIAAMTAKQVIHQKIREAEKGAIMDEFSGRVGNLISGVVLRFDGSNVRVDISRTEGLMPAEERVPSERLTSGQRMTFLLKSIEETPRGKQVILSRADPNFVIKLFEREVPEIASSSVEIKNIARDPGVRTKVAVFSDSAGVDPVGSCVGQKGVRVQAVTNELNGERVDIVPWNEDVKELITAALSPAEALSIKLDEKKKEARVVVPEDQLSIAIGRDGQNVRLASVLAGWQIEVEGAKESTGSKKAGKEAKGKKVAEEKEEAKKGEDKKEDKKKTQKSVKKE